MGEYLISVDHDAGFESIIVIEPLPGFMKKTLGRWHVENPISKTWRWAKIGEYVDNGAGQFEFQDTAGTPVFRLMRYTEPPTFGQTGVSGFNLKSAWADGKWTVLANENQLAEVRRQVRELEEEINSIYRQTMIDVIGCFDPTPISDTIGAAMAFREGQIIAGGLSLISIVPYLGDLIGKTAKGAKLLARLNRAREKFKILREVLEKLQKRMGAAKKAAKEKLIEHTRKRLQANMDAMRKVITRNMEEVANAAGLTPRQLANWRIFASQCEPPKLVILRNRNIDAIKYEGLPNYHPKPTDISLKCGKKGKNSGLVVYPEKLPMTAKEAKNIAKLKEKGYKFVPDEKPGSLLVGPQGQKFHSDVDKMGIYDINKLQSGKDYGTAWKGTRHNDAPEMQNEINDRVYEGIKNDQHGGQDFFYGKTMDGKGEFSKYDDVSQKWEMGLKPDPDEKFTIIHPDGSCGTASLDELDRIYSQYGIQNPYKLK